MSKNPHAYWSNRVLRIFVDLDFPALSTVEIFDLINTKYPRTAPSMKAISTLMGQSWMFKKVAPFDHDMNRWHVKWQVE